MTQSIPGARAWPALAAFTFLAGVTQTLWMNFAPLNAALMTRYGVSELYASTLVLVFPLFTVFLSLQAGALIDRRGVRVTVGWGAVATAACALVRIWDTHFQVLLAAQVGIAAAQPYVVNGITRLVAERFPEAHRTLPTGVGTMGLFLGMALGLAATPALVEATSLRVTMALCAALACVAAAVFFAVVREAPASSEVPAPPRRARALFAQRELALVFALATLGLGMFNGLTTWLEQLLALQGISAADAGLAGGALIGGGIVGAVLIPLLADLLGKKKPLLVGCATAATVLVVPLCTSATLPAALAFGAALGFCFLPAFALLLDLCTELAGKESAGLATGVLMLLGNAGGMVVIVAMALLKSGVSGRAPVWLLLGLCAATAALALLVRERAKV
jgi:predicted MFS family arabinose efflux permease